MLGAGIAGSVLAAVLARNGARVLLIDAGTHPRFAIGESTIPYTSVLTKVVGDRYGVPELKNLASFQSVRRNVTRSCGVKRNFGFVYQREGMPQRPDEINQFVIPKMLHTENHFFRQDIDAYMVRVAVLYGATLMQRTMVEHVDIDDSGVRLGTAAGDELLARYVVDASGHRSPVATKFGLREEPTRFKHHSRSLFTHMVGVRPYDDVMTPRSAYGNPSPWHQGTLHHVFDGGWLWVIPFDNESEGTNPLCSVGLTLDPRRYPKTLPPAAEFDAFLRRFPDIAPQFADARPVRNWVSTGRLQYSAASTVGDRYCVTAHAAGFIDALYSRGLTNTLEVINVLAWRLLDAVRDDDFSRERFSFVEELEQALLNANDDLVNNSFIAFRDYDMWNAVFRVWAISTVLGTFHLQGAYDTLRRTGSDRALRDLESAEFLGSPFPTHRGCNQLLRTSTELCLAVEAGEAKPGDVAAELFGALRGADFIPPPLGLDQPRNHFFNATPPRMLRTLKWARTKAPADISATVTKAIGGFAREHLSRGA
ncbi:FAD-dependent oxidoreductase [Streptomyces sedi]|uniref:FAD-dependent oxidoreductase n=1 Tax=Streptomyces sedi TaxID=555059 RepID=A0A5C4V4P0_9ACTN|nr:FAD-dependent oxidoreductase [Streptomyces sedi]